MSQFAKLPARFAVSAIVFCLGCGDEQERPPLASDRCGEPVCGVPQGAVRGTNPGPSDPDDPEPVPDGGSPALVGGEVVVASVPDLSELLPLSSAVLTLSTSIDSLTDYRGGPFELRLGTLPEWVVLEQIDGSADLIPTLVHVGGSASDLTLPILERTVLFDITEMLSTQPIPDPNRGHAIVHFVRNGIPAVGISVQIPEGVVAYDIGAAYTDAEDATSNRGAAALINLPAVPLPGGSLRIEATREGETRDLTLEVARSAVSLRTIEW